MDYDIIIAGAGAAGLNLAHALARAGLGDRRVLLADRAPKTANDRTWCFWERGDNALESIIYRRWTRLAVHSTDTSLLFNPAPYAYKMLRGSDFYAHMNSWLNSQTAIERVYGEVQGFDDDANGVSVRIDGRAFRARHAFSSLPAQPQAQPHQHSLLQHFLGWVIETETPAFDPATATLMDFRIEQAGATRFVYTLPLDSRRALVEFTVFSRELLPREDYARVLRSYIEQRLDVQEFAITHDEFGVIPMTDAPFTRRASAHVMNIGTSGGATKPSTGYTFLRTQRQARAIARALQAGRDPIIAAPGGAGRFRLYDSVLLNVLDKQRQGGAQVFARLFKANPAATIFKFLDEESSVLDELRVMASVDTRVFTAALVDVLSQR